jgi:transposase
MRFVDVRGEAVDVSGRSKLTDPELRRARDMAFARMRAQGLPVPAIAKYHRVSRSYVYERLAALPESARRRAVAS